MIFCICAHQSFGWRAELDILVFADRLVADFESEFLNGLADIGPLGKRGGAHIEDDVVLEGRKGFEEFGDIGAFAGGRAFAGIVERFDFEAA